MPTIISVSIPFPVSGASYPINSVLDIQAQCATGTGVSMERVEFRDNNNLLGKSVQSYHYLHAFSITGAHSISATAFGLSGATGVAYVPITIVGSNNSLANALATGAGVHFSGGGSQFQKAKRNIILSDGLETSGLATKWFHDMKAASNLNSIFPFNP